MNLNRTVNLAQVGSFSLEYSYLTDLLNEPDYKRRAMEIVQRLARMKTEFEGLCPEVIYPERHVQPDNSMTIFCANYSDFSIGIKSAVYYDYLLKSWLYSGKRESMPRRVYKNTIKKIKKHLIKEVNGRHFVISRKGGEVVNQQDHSACMLPGLLALGAHDEHDLPTMELAGKLMESCYRMYSDQKSGLAPTTISTTGAPVDKNWRQGSEVMQSLFILWRVTKDPKYRRWGVEIAQAIHRRTKVGAGGYAGVVDVTVFPPKLTDHQDGMAAMIRFFYLLCTTPEYLPLDEWVFSKEGHPFPINWKGTAYSKGITDQSE